MNILTNGKSMRKGTYQLQQETTVTGAAVASITYSGMDDEQPALDMRWLHASTGVQRLDLQLNGNAAPGGSKMVREQFETTTAVREDRLDPGFTIADLVAAIAGGTMWEGIICILADSTLEEVTYASGEGYANDAILTLGDRIRFSKRNGRWNDDSMGSVSSLTAVVGSGQSMIGIGSHFKLFN